MFGRVDQCSTSNRNISAFWRLYIIKHNDEVLYALNANDSENTLIDQRIINGSSKGPALIIFTALERVEIIEQGVLNGELHLREIGPVISNDFSLNLHFLIGGFNDV